MRFWIIAFIFVIALALSIFSSYVFFIPYNAFPFLIIILLSISNNVYPACLTSSKFYFVAFFAGFTLDCIQHNSIFYNSFIFTFIIFLNDLSKNIIGSKFIYFFLIIIGIYDRFALNTSFMVALLNVCLLYFFYRIATNLLKINYAKKD